MKTNNNFILRNIADEYVLIPVKEAAQSFNGMLHLTSTADYIWECVDKCDNLDEVIKSLMNEFEVDEEIAKNDVYGFLNELYIRNMVLDIPEFENKE